MTKPFVLYRNTKDRMEHEREHDVLDGMQEEAESIDFDEFSQNCDYDEIADQLGYNEDLPLENDWHVSYQKSNYGGLPCYILSHSECDFVFLKPADAAMLIEYHGQQAEKMSDLEWKRHTSYGKAGVDPS